MVKYFCSTINKDDKLFLTYPYTKMDNEILEKTPYIEINDDIYFFLLRKDNNEVKNVNKLKFYVEVNTKSISKISEIKELINDESKEDEQIEEDLQNKKIQYKYEARKCINDRTQMSSFVLFNFIKLDDKLKLNGFIVTDENREDKYLEVVNSGDENIIEILSEYLDAYDELQKLNIYYERYQEFVDAIDYVDNIKDLEDAYKEHIGDLWSE